MRMFVVLVSLSIVFAGAADADSLFTSGAAQQGTLISDKQVKFEVGDIITVLVQESIDASTESTTDTKKESAIQSEADASDNQFLVADKPSGLNIMPAARLPNWHIEMENEHKGAGATRRANKLVMTVACTVTKVYPNGNVRIEGEKLVTVNREKSKLSLSGLVRGRDVSPANTVASSQVADATIELNGQGPLWNNQRRGILTKVLDWFSPF